MPADPMQELIEAAKAVLQIAGAAIAAQDSPNRGEWGVECPLCMGELVEGVDRAGVERLRSALSRAERAKGGEITEAMVPDIVERGRHGEALTAAEAAQLAP